MWVKSLPSIISIFLAIPLIGQGECEFQLHEFTYSQVVDCPDTEWMLLFEDQFDGISIDESFWGYEFHDSAPADRMIWHKRNKDVICNGEEMNKKIAEHEAAILSPNNVVVSNGTVKLHYKNESENYSGLFEREFDPPLEIAPCGNEINDPFSIDFGYTIGGLIPLQECGFLPKGHLKMEARVRIPSKDGIWSAFWSFNGANEIDVFEVFGNGDNEEFRSSLFQHPQELNCGIDASRPNDNDFHIYTVIYTPWKIQIFLDDELKVEFHKYRNAISQQVFEGNCGDIFDSWIYHELRSFPIEQWWRPYLTGAIDRKKGEDGDVDVPAVFEIDWVRVWRKEFCDNVQNLIVDEDMTLTGSISYKDIIVEPDVTLNIENAEVLMGYKGKIDLKEGASLVVSNSSFDASCVEWQGLSVTHQGTTSFIYISNQSEFKNCSRCISNNSGIYLNSNGTIIENGGNLEVSVSESTFENPRNQDSHEDDKDLALSIVGNGDEINIEFLDCHFERITNSIYSHKGGSISFTDCTFSMGEDVNAIERPALYSYENTADNIIANCTFNNYSTALKFVRTQNQEIVQSNFQGKINFVQPTIGIDNFESSILVHNDNDFSDNNYGILSHGTFPLAAGMQIGLKDTPHNTFTGNFRAIECNGNDSPIGVDIFNNLINSETNVAGTILIGVNSCLLENNTFVGAQSAFVSASSGDNFNTYNCNRYLNNLLQDNAIIGDNRNSVFLQNDFLSPMVNNGNINLYNAVVNTQGEIANPASNCFTQPGSVDLTTDAMTQNFNYFYYVDEMVLCEEPSSNGNYNPLIGLLTGQNCFDGIGTTNISGGGGTNHNLNGNGGNSSTTNAGSEGFNLIPINTAYCKQCITSNISSWANLIIVNGGDNPYTENDESGESDNSNQYEEHLHQWVNYGLYQAMLNDDLDFAETILIDLKKWRWQIRLYGIYILKKEFANASVLLNSLPELTLDQEYFKKVQLINLKRLQSIDISTNEKELLHTIGTSTEPTSGYARSLYFSLTGNHLPFDVPIPESRINNRYKNISDLIEFQLFPNPAQTVLNIKQVNLVSGSLYDLNGNQITSVDFNQNEQQIDISKLKSGVYIMVAIDVNGKKMIQKVIKM